MDPAIVATTMTHMDPAETKAQALEVVVTPMDPETTMIHTALATMTLTAPVIRTRMDPAEIKARA